MKTILCYGDSNTYGYNPANGRRFSEIIRWTARLQALLGEGYKVIEEGCNGRTTIFPQPDEPWKNGLPYLRPCLNSHKPVDVVVLMLGTNDLKDVYNKSAASIAGGAEVLVDTIQEFTLLKQGYEAAVILVSPPELGEKMRISPFSDQFGDEAIKKSKELARLYQAVAEEKGCVFLNAARYVKASDADSLHLDASGHRILAEQIYDLVSGL